MTIDGRGRFYWSYFYIWGVRHHASTGTANRKLPETVGRKLKEQANLRRHQIELVEFDPAMTFGSLAARFIANAGPKPFHIDRLKHILPCFADVPLVGITKGMVREYRVERRERRPSITDATLNRDAAVLRHLLYWAVDEGLLLTNPLSRLRLERERRVKRSVLTIAEEDKILQAAPLHLRRMIVA